LAQDQEVSKLDVAVEVEVPVGPLSRLAEVVRQRQKIGELNAAIQIGVAKMCLFGVEYPCTKILLVENVIHR